MFGGRRFLARLELFERGLQLGLAFDQAGQRGVGRQRQDGIRIEIRDARDCAVGAGRQRFAADAGAGVVEQRTLGRQLPFLIEVLLTPALA